MTRAGVDSQRLQDQLIETFEADPAVARVVAREATDLADSSVYSEDFGTPLTVEIVLDNLESAPDDHDLTDRWNWWLGALELSHGGYQRFHVRSDIV